MHLPDLITVDRIACADDVSSKKRALEQLSQLMAEGQSSLTASEIFESLISRERLGSTGLGHGVALPHGRVKNTDHTIGAFLQLQRGIDFDAVDNEPVDLLFALLVPEQSTDEHLELLAQLAEMLSSSELRAALREASGPKAIYDLLNRWQEH